MDDDENDDDDQEGWKILEQDVILFETTIGTVDKPLPHPILDNPEKMMRIIANPLYDKLTLSRAAQIRNYNALESIRQSAQLNRPKERTIITPFKSEDIEQTTTTPLPNPSEISNGRPQSKSATKLQTSSPLPLPTPTTSNRKSPLRNIPSAAHSRATTAHSTSPSPQSTLIDTAANIQKPTAGGTIRYVNSRHGFEVQRYSSNNWLSTDVFTKDACQSHEKTFREMLDKKRQYERLARSVYSSEYYNKRWRDSLKSYKQGYLTHTEWAQQNYQLLCIKTLYDQAKKREQRDIDLDAKDVRRARAQSAYHQWKETKTEGNSERQHSRTNTARSQRITEGISFLSNTTGENNTTLADTSLPISTSISGDSEIQQTSIDQPIIVSKNTSATEKALYMLDKERWSLQAMLKRVVGLAEPLPPPPKVITRKESAMTNGSTDSGFESAL